MEAAKTMAAKSHMEQLPLVTQLPVEHLFDMHVGLQPGQAIPTALSARMTFITTGGRVDGPRVRGEILPGGGAWLQVGREAGGAGDAADRGGLADPLRGSRRHQDPVGRACKARRGRCAAVRRDVRPDDAEL